MKRGSMLGLTMALCALAALATAETVAASEIHGQVTDHLGEPIAGITVCAAALAPIGGGDCQWETDSEGRYSIDDLHAGSYRVGFHVESHPSLNYIPQWYNGKAHPEEADGVELAEGESREIDAQLQTGGQVRGKVADQATDLPIAGVEVCAELLGFFQTGEVRYCDRSNSAGEFTVKNLGTGQYRLEFRTEGHVNYVEKQLPEPPGSIPVNAGGMLEVEAHLVPGVEIEGTLSDARTGQPIVGLPGPSTWPGVCALDPTTEARVKCAGMESNGEYSIAGLPADTYAVAFSLDRVEEGFDLHPDGYVRRYWQEVPSFDEATLLAGTPGAVFDEIDAVLTPGDEVFPRCEVQSACPSPPPSGATSSSGAVIPPALIPPPAMPIEPRCKRGFRRVKKAGHARCVKRHKRHRKHRHQRAQRG